QISLMITYANEADRCDVVSHYADYGDRVEIFADRVIPNPHFSPRVLLNQDPPASFTPENYKTRCFLATPMLNPNGDLFSCHIGKAAAHGDLRHLPYFLGNLREQPFEDIMRAARSRADYQYLRTHGPRGVAELVQTKPELAKAV